MRDNPPYPLFFLFCKSGGCNVRQTLFSLGRPAWPRGLVMREGDVFRLQKVWGAEIQNINGGIQYGIRNAICRIQVT
jgi:hypothetical protein